MNQVAPATNQVDTALDRPVAWVRLGGAGVLLLTGLGVLQHLAWPVLGIAVLVGSRWPGKDLRSSIAPMLVMLVAAGGLVASALRWSTFDLAAITGAQGVLGPALLVGPGEAAAATALGMTSVLLALALALPPDLEWDRRGWALWAAELLGIGAALALLSWGPGGAMGEMWLAAVTLAVLTGSIGWALSRAPALVAHVSLGAAGLCAGVGALMSQIRA
ncbi:MAG: hypothetical protein ACR2KQ_08785 [Actinomycetota bacterium]